MDFSTLENSVTAKKWVIGIFLVVMLLYVFRMLIVGNYIYSFENVIGKMAHDQEVQLKKTHDEVDESASDIAQHMVEGERRISQGRDALNQKLEASESDFTESVKRAEQSDEDEWQKRDKADKEFKAMIANNFEKDSKAMHEDLRKEFDEEEVFEKRGKAACAAKYRPFILCEKAIFNHTVYNAKDPCAYDMFWNGVPKEYKWAPACRHLIKGNVS